MTNRRTAILHASAKAIAERGVRGLRVNDVAELAGVSPGLLYYHFNDREGLLDAALRYVNERANAYRALSDAPGDTPLKRVRRHLLGEIQDDPDVVENSTAWNELRASALFEESLRGPVADAAARWADDIAAGIREAQTSGEVPADVDARTAALTLTVFVDGLDGRWLCGDLSVRKARALLRRAIDSTLRL